MIRTAAALIVLGGAARADQLADPPPSPPDPVAETTANEANLASNAHHDGFVFTAALGGGLTLGDGVGRGASGSVRAGLRRRDVVETLEVSVGSLLHEPAGGPLLHNDDVNIMGGIQYYTTPSLWVRGAGGLTEYSVQNLTPAMMTITQTHLGAGALVSVGVDVVRARHFVLDIEAFTALSIVGTKGLLATSALCLGASIY